MSQAQHRYKRLMVVAGQRTVPAHEQVFRQLDNEKHLGHDRMAPHFVPEDQRIPETIAEQQRITLEPGPYSDKLNNMYMQNWNQAAYPFVKVRHLKPWGAPEGIEAAEVRGGPRDARHGPRAHHEALTPWRNEQKWTKHQKTACAGTQHRLAAVKAKKAVPDPATIARSKKNMEAHKMSALCHQAEDVPQMRKLAIKDELTGAVRYAPITGDIRPPWRKAGVGVMKPKGKKIQDLQDGIPGRYPMGTDWTDGTTPNMDGDVLGGIDS